MRLRGYPLLRVFACALVVDALGIQQMLALGVSVTVYRRPVRLK